MKYKKKELKPSMNKKGFTLVEMLVSLWALSLSLLLIGTLMKIVVKNEYTLYQQEDYAFLHQMRLLYGLSMDCAIYDEMLHFRYKGEEMYYEKQDDKLLLKEGYQVFLQDIEEAYFEKRKECHYLIYQRNNTKKAHLIGCS